MTHAIDWDKLNKYKINTNKMKEPLVIIFIWYESDNAKVEPYLEIFRENLMRTPKKPFSRELHLPLYFFGLHKGEKFPEIKSEADNTIVFVFTSSGLVANDKWNKKIKKISGIFHLIPIALDDNGFNYEGLDYRNAIRTMDFKDSSIQKQKVMLFALHEIYRTVSRCKDNERLNIFISHCKGSVGEQFAKMLMNLIDKSTLSRFFDAYSIFPGEQFDNSIRKSIKKSTLIAINSDRYDERRWCQYELIKAKCYNRPIVAVDLLSEGTDRSFPYGANIPVIRFKQPCVKSQILIEPFLLNVLILAIRESIRFTVEKIKLKAICKGYKVCCNVPEPIFIKKKIGYNTRKKTKVLYPDPPVFPDENKLLKAMGIKAVTPSTMDKGSVKGMKIQISISEPDSYELKSLGMNKNHIQALQYSITHFLAGAGADIVYGGYLKEDSITTSVCEELLEWKRRSKNFYGKLLNYETSKNINGPDDKRSDVESIIARFNSVLDVYVEMDGIMVPYADFYESSTDSKKALSIMRQAMAYISDAHIIVGGICHNYSGVMPGILEEFLYSAEREKPIYLLGAFGGASAKICDLYSNKIKDDEFYGSFQKSVDKKDGDDKKKEKQIRLVADYIHKLNFRNGLSYDENSILMTSRSEYEIIGLIRKGLGKLNKK